MPEDLFEILENIRPNREIVKTKSVIYSWRHFIIAWWTNDVVVVIYIIGWTTTVFKNDLL